MDQQAAAMSRMRSSQPSRRAAGLRRVVALRDRARALIWWSGSSMRDSVVDGKGTVELKTDGALIECDPDALSFAAANDTTTLPLPAPASKLAGDPVRVEGGAPGAGLGLKFSGGGRSRGWGCP